MPSCSLVEPSRDVLLLVLLLLLLFDVYVQIDLDTIETSNLNRQFLFRRSHVGQSKAQVAAEVVTAFAPAANIKAYQVRLQRPQRQQQLCVRALAACGMQWPEAC